MISACATLLFVLTLLMLAHATLATFELSAWAHFSDSPYKIQSLQLNSCVSLILHKSLGVSTHQTLLRHECLFRLRFSFCSQTLSCWHPFQRIEIDPSSSDLRYRLTAIDVRQFDLVNLIECRTSPCGGMQSTLSLTRKKSALNRISFFKSYFDLKLFILVQCATLNTLWLSSHEEPTDDKRHNWLFTHLHIYRVSAHEVLFKNWN